MVLSAGGFRPARMLVQMMLMMQRRLERRRQRAMPVFFLLLQRLVVGVGRRSRVAHYDGRLILWDIMGRVSSHNLRFKLLSLLQLLREGAAEICWRIRHKETADEQRRSLSLSLLPE